MSDIFDLTCELVCRASVTPDDAGCQQLLGDRLRHAGFAIENLRFGEVDNLWATHGSGAPVFVFLGHTDVVPPGPLDQWTSAPFEPTVRNGRLYGRGAADMKSSVAAMTLALEAFVAKYPAHKGTIALLVTSDEEGPSRDGVKKVVEEFRRRGQGIDYCVVGEPSSIDRFGDLIRIGRRGSLSGKLIVKGVQGHIAYPDKAKNVIHAFAPALDALTREVWDAGNTEFPPTSFQFSNLNAGTGAGNIIPGRLETRFNFRYSPESTAENLQARVESILRNHAVEYEIEWDLSGQPFITHAGALRVAAIAAIEEVCGITPRADTGGGTSDGRFIAPLGAEVVEAGPINASIHKIDEHIALDELEKLPTLYLRIAERLFA